MNGKRRKERNQAHFKTLVLTFDFLLTSLSILLVGWQGSTVTEKFVSKPHKMSTSYEALEDIPPTAISVCYVLKVTDCSESSNTFSIFDYSYYDYYDDDADDCTWKNGEIGSFGNSTDAFWNEVESRGEPVDVEKIIKSLELWDPLAESWHDVLTDNSTSITRSVTHSDTH